MEKSIKRLNLIDVKSPYKIGDVLWESPFESKSKANIITDLESLGALALNNGRFIYRGIYASAINYARQLTLAIANELEFEHWYLPKIIPENVAKKFGLIKAWPSYLVTLNPLKESFENHKTTLNLSTENYFLDPVQCAPLYEYISSKNLTEICPIKIVDSSGYTYRNEFQDKLNGTIQSVEFLRTEHVFIGENIVKKLRSDLLNEYIKLFSKFKFKFRLIVGSGCYEIPTNDDLEEYKNAMDVESIPIIDIEVFSESMNEWIEIIGASHLFQRKLKNFGFSENSGYESGCLGVGLTRLAALIIEYLGTDIKDWHQI